MGGGWGSGSGGGFHAGFGVLGRVGSGLGLGWVGGVGVCAGGAGPRGGRLDEQGQVAQVLERCGEDAGPGPVEGQAQDVAA